MNLDSTQTRITNKQNCIPFPERILPQNSNHPHPKTDVYPLTFSNNTRKSIRNDYTTTQSHCFTNPKAVPLPQIFSNNIVNQPIIGGYNNNNNMVNTNNNMVNTNNNMVNTNNNSNHIFNDNFQNDRNNDITNCYNLKTNPMNDRMLPIDTRHTFKPQD